MSKVQESVHQESNIEHFKRVYGEIVAECLARRKSANLTQKDLADMLKVDRRREGK